MDFALTVEQGLLRDSVRRFIDKDHGFEARTARVHSGQACDTRRWTALADNGWLAAALPEDAGGLGGSAFEAMLIATELGRGLVVEPYTVSAVLAAQTFVAAATPEQSRRHGPQLADGSLRLALAGTCQQTSRLAATAHTTAQPQGDGWRLDGAPALISGTADAHAFIVAAAMPSADAKPPQPALFLVDAGLPGVRRTALPLHDGSWAADVRLEAVHVPARALLGMPSQAHAALQLGLGHGMASLCAELVGGMEKAIELTADYLKVRQQFGVPIASFQALQHRMADMAAEMELARSMVYVLLAAIRNESPDRIEAVASQAKSLVGRAARQVCAQAIQLHGGIGMTEECAVGHYFKRAVVADTLFGNADAHDARSAVRMRARAFT